MQPVLWETTCTVQTQHASRNTPTFTRGHVTSPPPTPSSQLDTGGNIHRGDDAVTGSQPPLAPRQQPPCTMACNWLIGGPPSPEPTTNQTPAQSLGADSYLLRTPFPARRLIVTAVHVGPPSPTHHHHTAILFVPSLGRKSLQTPLSSPRSKQEGGKSAVAQFSFARQKLDCLALRWITSPLSGETMVLEIAPRKIKKEREREKNKRPQC